MGLDEYSKKRDFRKTPEPRGGRQKDRPIFVVQKHAARRTHYDFRIECQGVLKSWAVPKGFSADPNVKRLAVQVEDHPLDYADFENVIPQGEYGAGPVIVWDKGTYEVRDREGRLMTQDGVAQKIQNGELTVELSGQKLQGQYVLVKGKERNWLLFRKKNQTAVSDSWDEKSVKTGRSLEQVRSGIELGNSRKLPVLSRFPKSEMPLSLRPMLAKTADAPFDKKGWGFEIKLDGYRVLAFVNRGRVKLLSRNQKDYTEEFAAVSRELSESHDCILDGEVVVLDDHGRPSFQALQNFIKLGEGILVYYVFDILHLDGRDLRGATYAQRRRILDSFLPTSQIVRLGGSFETYGRALYKEAIKQGLEGVMAKKLDSRYVPGIRSESWLKVKSRRTAEFLICGWNYLKGRASGIGALILGRYERGDLVFAGKVGSGIEQEELQPKLAQMQAQASPISESVAEKNVNWVKPELVCSIEFAEMTNDGKLRHPVYVGLREDISAEDLRQESLPQDAPEKIRRFGKTAPGRKGESQIFSAREISFELTHLDRVFWPDDGYTKKDLLDYYRSVAKYILPYLKDRPQSLNRYPHGLGEQNFYQKNNPELPDWATSVELASESRGQNIRYLFCNDLPTLLYLVQLGCIEMNVWNSRWQKPDYPDYLVLDLDPEGIEFQAVVEVAQKIKKLLDLIRVRGYCKTSGATGLHVYVPLGAAYTYEQTRLFAEAIMNVVYAQTSDATSLERNPEKRPGKVYLDFLQNRRGQTMAAPYCVRPRTGAPVSMPLEWHEVNSKLRIDSFNLRTAAKRLEKKGDLWQPVLGKGIDMVKCMKLLKKSFS